MHAIKQAILFWKKVHHHIPLASKVRFRTLLFFLLSFSFFFIFFFKSLPLLWDSVSTFVPCYCCRNVMISSLWWCFAVVCLSFLDMIRFPWDFYKTRPLIQAKRSLQVSRVGLTPTAFWSKQSCLLCHRLRCLCNSPFVTPWPSCPHTVLFLSSPKRVLLVYI